MLRPFLQVVGSKAAGAALGFLYAAVAARILGPTDYGLLAFAFAITAVASELTGYGLETSLVRIAAGSLAARDRASALAAYRTVFKLKLLVNGSLLLAGWVLAGPLASLLGDPRYRLPIQLGALGALGFSLWRLVLAILQSLEAFGFYAIVQSVGGLFKIVALAVVLAVARAGLQLFLAIHVGSFFVGFLLGGLLSPPGSLRVGLEEDHATRLAVLRFGKWIVASSFLSIVNAWLGVFTVGYFITAHVVGEYAAAHTLLTGLDIFMVSLNTLFLPAACRIGGRSDGIGYLKRTLAVSAPLSVGLLPLYFLAEPIVTTVYSADFHASSGVFRILFWGFLASLNIEPALLILYARNRPSLIAALEAFKLLLGLGGYILLIPRFALPGAAVASTLSRVVGAAAGIAVVARELRAAPASSVGHRV